MRCGDVIGYLVADQPRKGLVPLLLFTAVMFLHRMGRDHTLAERYGALHRGTIRWILAAAMLAGWAVGILTTLSPATVALWFAFLAGSITLNVMGEELPRGNLRRFRPFVVGAAVVGAALCTALLPLFERCRLLESM